MQEKYEELKMTARAVSEPAASELVSRAEGYAAGQVSEAMVQLKSTVNNAVNELADKLLAEAQKFGELKQAVDLTKKNLELHYHIQVAAETLEQLVQEYRAKTVALEEEIAGRRRDWAREQEEHEYATGREWKREEELRKEAQARREQALAEREQALANRESEWQTLKQQAENFPQVLEKATAQKEQEVSKRLAAEQERQMEAAKKDWQAQKNIYELRLAGLEENSKRQAGEISLLKMEAERAGKKAQELAVKVIESNAPRVAGAASGEKSE